jgi:Protein of unknown function (DUF3551)
MIRAAFVLLAFGALAALDSRPSAAEINRPWCVRGDFETCTFTSFQQCMMTARGTGDCVPNPWHYGPGQLGSQQR